MTYKLTRWSELLHFAYSLSHDCAMSHPVGRAAGFEKFMDLGDMYFFT